MIAYRWEATWVTHLIFLKSIPFSVPLIWSANLPGVATTMCGFLFKMVACSSESIMHKALTIYWFCNLTGRFDLPIPPTTTAVRTLMGFPRRANCSDIWNANSLVGVRTRQKIPYGSSDNFWRIGRANAAVLPVPVFEHPMQPCPGKLNNLKYNCKGKYAFRSSRERKLW